MDQLYAFAATHHGVVSRSEARALGLSESQISRASGRGRLSRVAPGVYAVAGSVDSWHQRARTAVLSTGGLLSHRAAAQLHGIDGFTNRQIEVVVPKGRRIKRPDVTVRRTTQWKLAGPIEIEAVTTTSVPRTVLDVAGLVGHRQLEWLVDAVLRQGLCDWPDLLDVWVRHSAQGRNGCGRLRRLLEERCGESSIPDSRWNRMVGRLLTDSGAGTPRYEHRVEGAGGRFIARVDLAYPSRRVAIELDSVRWHLNRESFEDDPRRKNRLTQQGWTVLTFTWNDYTNRPWEIVRTVKAVLAA